MSQVPHPHRREFSRVRVHLEAEVTVDGVRRTGTIESLSLKGTFFRTGSAAPEGAPCDIRLHLEGTQVEVHAQGRVVRRGTGGFAIQFTEIVGIDSLEHLRNLIRFNTHEPDRVEEEFHCHLGLKREP